MSKGTRVSSPKFSSAQVPPTRFGGVQPPLYVLCGVCPETEPADRHVLSLLRPLLRARAGWADREMNRKTNPAGPVKNGDCSAPFACETMDNGRQRGMTMERSMYVLLLRRRWGGGQRPPGQRHGGSIQWDRIALLSSRSDYNYIHGPPSPFPLYDIGRRVLLLFYLLLRPVHPIHITSRIFLPVWQDLVACLIVCRLFFLSYEG